MLLRTHILILLLFICLLIFPTISSAQAKWTIMVYLEEVNLDGESDINEMEVGGSIPDTVNILVLFNQGYYSDLPTAIYYIEHDLLGNNTTVISNAVNDSGMVIPEGVTELVMDDPNILYNFLYWSITNYPAEHYLLDLWDHGDGIFKGETDNKSVCGDLKLWQISEKIEEVLIATEEDKIDIIGFDVCLLGQIETAYEFKDICNICIASEENEPGPGWDYAPPMDMLYNNPNTIPRDLASEIVQSFLDFYEYDPYWSTTQAASDLTLFDSVLIPALDDFAYQLYHNMYDNETTIKNAKNNAEYYNYLCPDIYHFAELINANTTLSTSLRNSALEFMSAMDTVIIHHGHTGSNTTNEHGFSIWFPNNIANEGIEEEYYTNSLNYLKFCNTFWDDFLYMYADPHLTITTIRLENTIAHNNIITADEEIHYSFYIPADALNFTLEITNADGDVIDLYIAFMDSVNVRTNPDFAEEDTLGNQTIIIDQFTNPTLQTDGYYYILLVGKEGGNYTITANHNGNTGLVYYDDGIAEFGEDVIDIDAGFAIRFTPLNYPADLTETQFYVYEIDTTKSANMKIHIYDDNGIDNSPGDLLRESISISVDTIGWYTLLLDDIPIIESGDVYILLTWDDPSAIMLLGMDEKANCNDRSWYFDGTDTWYALEVLNIAWRPMIRLIAPQSTTDIEQEEPLAYTIPKDYNIMQNYPNPFNPDTYITFELPKYDKINLSIYNLSGQLVRILCDDNYKAGRYTLHWNGKDNQGNKLSSGIYIYRLSTVDYKESRKMILLK